MYGSPLLWGHDPGRIQSTSSSTANSLIVVITRTSSRATDADSSCQLMYRLSLETAATTEELKPLDVTLTCPVVLWLQLFSSPQQRQLLQHFSASFVRTSFINVLVSSVQWLKIVSVHLRSLSEQSD